MKNQLSTVTEVVVRSTFYIITNFVVNKIAARWPAKAVAQFFYFF